MLKKSCVYFGGMEVGVVCLKHLLAQGIRPALVIANPNDHGRDASWYPSTVKFCRAKKLKVIVPKKLKDQKIIAQVQAAKPDIIFTVGGSRIIPREILAAAKTGTVNIHPSLLPKYGGRSPAAQAIFHGEKIAGTTLHWVTEDVDSGPIIFQEHIKIENDDTAKTLYKKLYVDLGEKLFKKFVDAWVSGKRLPSRPQGHVGASYFSKNDFPSNNGEVDWSWNGKKIRDFIRAMTFEPMDPPVLRIGQREFVAIEKKHFHGYGTHR